MNKVRKGAPAFHKMAIERTRVSAKRLQLSALEDAQYHPGSYNFVNFSAALEHVQDPSAAIAKVVSWLKPGGVAHIEVPSSAWLLSKLFNAYFFLRGTDFVVNLSPMHPPLHLYEFSLKSFRANAKANHFEIAHHQYHVCTTYHLPKIFHNILLPLMRATDTGLELSVWLRRGPADESQRASA